MKNEIKTKMKTKIKMNFRFYFHFELHFGFCFLFFLSKSVYIFVSSMWPRGTIDSQLSLTLPRSAIAFLFAIFSHGLAAP